MKIRILFITLLMPFFCFAQQPFKQYGYSVRVSTLSQGKYSEDFTSDSIVQVGSVMLNRITGKIVSFVIYDTSYSEATLNPELISRWMSPDPIADKYFSFSPYNYAINNPIRFIDILGLFPGDPTEDPTIRENRASNLFGQIRTVNGEQCSGNHQGFDYAAPIGTEALSVRNGLVVGVDNTDDSDYGLNLTVEVYGDDGSVSYAFYAHLSSIIVEEGEMVNEGDVVGLTGTTGNADASSPHLHFENRAQQNPGTGLHGRENPNNIVDTQFVSQDPNANQTTTGVRKISPDGTETNQNLDGSQTVVNQQDQEDRQKP